MLKVFKVVGESMQPTLYEGDFVIASRFYRSINIGDIVLCKHPQYHYIIKRISEISSNQLFLLSGDNVHQSVSSAQIGWIEPELIYGKVICSIRK